MPLCGLNSIQSGQNNVQEIYQKHVLLDHLVEDDEMLESKDDITEFFPDIRSSKFELLSENPIIEGSKEIYHRLRELLCFTIGQC